MKIHIHVLLFLFVLLSFAGIASVESHPRFAVREAVTCQRCHVDNQGAALRNEYGAGYYSRQVLPMDLWEDFGGEEFTASIHEAIRWGTDIRMQYYSYSEEGSSRDAFFPMQGDLYLGITPLEKLTLYGEASLFNLDAIRPDGRPAPAVRIWAQYELPNERGYVRVGQYNPAYGLRLDDHTSLIRGGNDGGGVINSAVANIPPDYQGLHWKPDRAARGLSLHFNTLGMEMTGYYGQPVSGSEGVAAVDLKSAFWAGEFNVLVGGSALNGSYTGNRRYTFAGLYGGVNYGRITLLGEVDVHSDYTASGSMGYVTYSEMEISLVQGLSAVLEYEFYDADIEYSRNAFSRVSIGADLFPIPYLEILPQYRLVNVTNDSDFGRQEFILQGHLWF